MDTPKVDCHVHVFEPDRFPYADDAYYRPTGAEIGTATQLGHVLDAHGVTHALLVGPNSGYNLDNRCMLDAIAHGNGRFKGVAVVRNDASRGELEDLKAAGIVGIAFHPALLGVDFYRDIGPLLARMRELDLWAQVQVEHDLLVEMRALLVDSGAKLLFDHCGRPHVERGVGQPGFRTLLDIAQTGRACVKLSGYVKFSRHPFPYPDARPYVQALVEAYTAQSLVWASDWPFLRVPMRIDYGPLVDLFASLVPDARTRAAIGWDTPGRLFGFALRA